MRDVTTGSGDLVGDALALGPLIAEHADDAEHSRRLALPTVRALAEVDLMRMCVPVDYGGPAADPQTMVRAIEAVAIADGAAGWCAMIASTTSSMAAFLPTETAREIYGARGAITGGVFAPNGTGQATVVDGGRPGFAVTGRWPWGSGTQHCSWILGGVNCDDGTFRLCWFPQHAVTFHDTWHSSGMRGSGSLDFSVTDELVPADRTMQPGVTRPVVDTPLAHFPNFCLLAAGVAAVGLGVARHALDELIALAADKRPQFSSRTLARSGYTQVEVARAEAKLRAARALLLAELGETWERCLAGENVPLDARVGIRLAATHAATVGAEVADVAYTLAGGTAVYETSPLGRCARDAHVVTQHIQTAPKLNETLGRLLLGVDADSAML